MQVGSQLPITQKWLRTEGWALVAIRIKEWKKQRPGWDHRRQKNARLWQRGQLGSFCCCSLWWWEWRGGGELGRMRWAHTVQYGPAGRDNKVCIQRNTQVTGQRWERKKNIPQTHLTKAGIMQSHAFSSTLLGVMRGGMASQINNSSKKELYGIKSKVYK